MPVLHKLQFLYAFNPVKPDGKPMISNPKFHASK